MTAPRSVSSQVQYPFDLCVQLRNGKWLVYHIPFFSLDDLSRVRVDSSVPGGEPYSLTRPLGAALNHLLAVSGEERRRGHPLANDPDDVGLRERKVGRVLRGWYSGAKAFSAAPDPMLVYCPGGAPVIWGHCAAARWEGAGGDTFNVSGRGPIPNMEGDNHREEVAGLTVDQIELPRTVEKVGAHVRIDCGQTGIISAVNHDLGAVSAEVNLDDGGTVRLPILELQMLDPRIMRYDELLERYEQSLIHGRTVARCRTVALTAEEALRQAEAEGLALQPSDNKAGLKGVIFISGKSKPYIARVTRGGTQVSLGSFATAEEAAVAYAKYMQSLGAEDKLQNRQTFAKRKRAEGLCGKEVEALHAQDQQSQQHLTDAAPTPTEQPAVRSRRVAPKVVDKKMVEMEEVEEMEVGKKKKKTAVRVTLTRVDGSLGIRMSGNVVTGVKAGGAGEKAGLLVHDHVDEVQDKATALASFDSLLPKDKEVPIKMRLTRYL